MDEKKPIYTTKGEAQDVAADFKRYALTNDKSLIEGYTKAQIKCALALIPSCYSNRYWYKLMEKRIEELELEEKLKQEKRLIINQKKQFNNAPGVRPMTSEEKKAKGKHGYKSWDTLEFLNERTKTGSYYIKISNGKKEAIPAAQLLLLIFFARELKKNRKGWVSREDAAEAWVIDPYVDNHFDDLLHKLRNRIGVGAQLKTCNKDEFFETNDKKFRISTLPNRIKVQDRKWLNQAFKEILDGLMKKRKKKGNEQWDGWRKYEKTIVEQFKKEGFNYYTFLPKLLEKGYVENRRVNPKFDFLDDEFKKCFSEHTEAEFERIETILQLYKKIK